MDLAPLSPYLALLRETHSPRSSGTLLMLRSATVYTLSGCCEADCNSCNQVRPSHLLGISLGVLEGKHSLTITKTSVATFGNYSCVAKNSLGTFKKHIEVNISWVQYLWWV